MKVAAKAARPLGSVGASAAAAGVTRPGATTSAAPAARVVTARASSPERVVDIGSLSAAVHGKDPNRREPGALGLRPAFLDGVWSRSRLTGIPTRRDPGSRPTAAGQCRTSTGFPRQVRVGAALPGDAATLLLGTAGRNHGGGAVIIVTTGARAVISGEPPEERDDLRVVLTRPGRRGHVTTWCKSGRPPGTASEVVPRWSSGHEPGPSSSSARADDPARSTRHDLPEGVHHRRAHRRRVRRPGEPPLPAGRGGRARALGRRRHLPGVGRAPAGRRGGRQRVRLLRRPALRQRPAPLRAPPHRLRQGRRAALRDDARAAASSGASGGTPTGCRPSSRR